MSEQKGKGGRERISSDRTKSQEKRADERISGTQLSTKKSLGDPKKGLEKQRYYHGFLPREEINQLLQKDGDFLVRQSKKQDRVIICLSCFWQRPMHFTFEYDDNGQCRLARRSFASVPHLIHYHYTTQTPLTQSIAAVLKNPIFKLEWALDNNDIQLANKLGELQGQFGEVHRGFLRKDGAIRVVAVKACNDKIAESEKQKFVSEATTMLRFKHQNIVQFIGVAAQQTPILIVMELMTGGSLVNYLVQNKKHVSQREKLKFCVDAAAGMKYLPLKGCIHRDLAARNCLLDNNRNVKISDFGMSRIVSYYETNLKGKKIPVRWTALEALTYGVYGTKTDVWSYGILMWEIFADGTMPYPSISNEKVLPFLREGNRLRAPADTPKEIQDLMQLCWLKEPISRPNFTKIKECIIEIQKKYSR